MKKKSIVVLLIILVLFSPQVFSVKADNLKDEIDNQISNIDLSELEEYFNNTTNNGKDLLSYVYDILNGESSLSFENVLEYLKSIFLNRLKDSSKFFLVLLSIVLLLSFFGFRVDTKVSKTVKYIFACLLIVLLSSCIIYLFNETKNTINNLSFLNNIMSPIMITLMIASEGKVSASLYKPIVSVFSNGILNVLSVVLIPILLVTTVFRFIGKLNSNFKLNGFADFGESIIKWILGITFTVFGLFITVQGISSATFDGISYKATRYALSNSIPIIGNFISGGFDLILAGTVLIKNAVGIGVVIALFYTISGPLLTLLSFSIVIKLCSSFTTVLGFNDVTDCLNGTTKTINYLNAFLILSAFMFFIMIVLLIISANTVI